MEDLRFNGPYNSITVVSSQAVKWENERVQHAIEPRGIESNKEPQYIPLEKKLIYSFVRQVLSEDSENNLGPSCKIDTCSMLSSLNWRGDGKTPYQEGHLTGSQVIKFFPAQLG